MVIRPRRSLPGSRSVVGGLLVTVAALLAWWAAADAGGAPQTRFLVAAHPIGAGQVITAEDLATQPVDLPAGLTRSAFVQPQSVVGRVSLGPLGAGELIQATALSDAAPLGERELTFPVSSAWALDGALRPGDRIDVFATYGDGTSSQTLRILANATIRRTGGSNSQRLGEAAGPTITVALPPEVPLEQVVNATRAAELTVVRVTGAQGRPLDRRTDRYRAEADLAATDPGASDLGAGDPGRTGDTTDQPQVGDPAGTNAAGTDAAGASDQVGQP